MKNFEDVHGLINSGKYNFTLSPEKATSFEEGQQHCFDGYRIEMMFQLDVVEAIINNCRLIEASEAHDLYEMACGDSACGYSHDYHAIVRRARALAENYNDNL